MLDGVDSIADNQVHTGSGRNFQDLIGTLALGLVFGGDELGLLFDFGLTRLGLIFGALQIDQVYGELLPIAALDAVVADAIRLHLVIADQMEIAILQVQLDVCSEGGESEKENQVSGKAHTSMITASVHIAMMGRMRYRKLGNTKLEVSEIGYGAWGIGGKQWLGGSDDEAAPALPRALGLGRTFIDTALAYADGLTAGTGGNGNNAAN